MVLIQGRMAILTLIVLAVCLLTKENASLIFWFIIQHLVKLRHYKLKHPMVLSVPFGDQYSPILKWLIYIGLRTV